MKARHITAATALGVSLVACGSSTPPSEPAARGDARGPITFIGGKFEAESVQKIVDAWNASHPEERADVELLPESADEQRRKLIQSAQTKSGTGDVILIDAVWTSEFAANRWIDELPLDTSAFLPPTVDTATYRDKLYAMPLFTGTGLLYYRTDLVEKPPRTWEELKGLCERILPEHKGMSCYGGQFDKFEGLTVNFAEAVHSAGGELVDASGQPQVTSDAAKKAARFLADGFSSGMIPKEAITYKEEEGRVAFQDGKLLFYRNWAYGYEAGQKSDGSSKVSGKFDVAPIPGLDGPGSGTLGGNNLAVSAFSRHKQSARDFIAFMTSAAQSKAFALTSSMPVARAEIYDDAELIKKYPYLPALKAGILAAKPRPKAVRYGDVTAAIQESAYAIVTGSKPVDQALTEMQTALGPLLK